jgi:hypothetical protein
MFGPTRIGTTRLALLVSIVAVIAACALLVAGFAVAGALQAPAGAPTQSQQPADTSPTPN